MARSIDWTRSTRADLKRLSKRESDRVERAVDRLRNGSTRQPARFGPVFWRTSNMELQPTNMLRGRYD